MIINGSMKTHATTVTDLTMVARMGGLQRWSDNNHVMLFFQMGGPITILYRHVEFIPHSIQQLIDSQKLRSEKTKPKDFSIMNSKELYEYLWPILHTKQLATYKTNYVLTPDNLLKMALIYKKVMARVPVVIMGETGCGKTSLLKTLAQYCDVELFCMTLHAGTSENDIRKFVAKAESEAVHNKKVRITKFYS
jgi:chromosomal replication initiation ATPase DnaA